ncbi:MAG: TetR/AcrR family transcriptional regulator [Actinobacteria bacterium]|nr:TetR/AcrR family transcriptional regulator [Actinomycetota bacterium]
MPRVKQRTPQLRDHILEVARTSLAADGIESIAARRVAADAGTSIAAIYELFGDKAGLIREIFYDGFRRLRDHLDTADATDDPIADLRALMRAFREFARANPSLISVMYARPYDDFAPGPAESATGNATREAVTGRVRRAIEQGRLHGNAGDIAHVLLATCQGLALQETAGWLGTSVASRNRRWNLAADMLLTASATTAQQRR